MNALILKIEKPGYGGLFIARHEGKVVMVKGAVLPGETVAAEVDSDKKDYLTASVTEIIEPSTERTEPRCTHFGVCGGCSYQHIPYNLQVRLKEDILRDSLKRVAKIDISLDNSIINKEPWHYKIRAQFKLSDSGIGFHKQATRDAVPLDKCPIMTAGINESIPRTGPLLKGTGIKEIHITEGNSIIAQVIARESDLRPSDAGKLASALLDSGISGVTVIRGNTMPMKFGISFTSLRINSIDYTLSPSSFVQSNWRLNCIVADFIKKHLQPLHGKKILDLYAGAGNFALPLAQEAEVTAVEGNPFAIEDGRRNIKINGIKNFRFIHSPAEDIHTDEHFDIVILDPPRPGLTKKAMRKVIKILPETIVYVSCNPSTFARDLRTLTDKYEIESVRMIDFFPQTSHIEALAFLRLK
jgi:23S rRNA (uracil1939-C5)-methyltransferase